MKFHPYEKGGGERGTEKSFSHAEGGGHEMFWGNFYAVARNFSHTEEGGVAKSVHSLKGRALKV